MAFFGLTCLAQGNSMETIFRQHQARQLGVHDIPDERWDELFHNFSLTNVDTVLSSRGRLKLDPSRTMMRCDLAMLFKEIVSKDPSNEQMDAFKTYFNTDTSGCISYEEYKDSYTRIKNRSSVPINAVNYRSKNQMVKDHLKHRRVDSNLQDMYQRPMTTAQEIGWMAMAPKTVDPLVADTGKIEYNPRLKTDVTQGEGRCVTEYFSGR